ncbi:MAG: hypothetical protein P4K83_08675 [Terracidiphilus sp.]|nr:hypothetical protein [Terracidiphilus sp.]
MISRQILRLISRQILRLISRQILRLIPRLIRLLIPRLSPTLICSLGNTPPNSAKAAEQYGQSECKQETTWSIPLRPKLRTPAVIKRHFYHPFTFLMLIRICG